MERNDIINSFEYKVSKEAVERAKDGIDIPSFEDGAEFAKKLIYSGVIEWLRFHIQVDEPQIEYNEEGQPLAESFLAHAEARCMTADEVVNKFKQDFGLC